MPAAESAESAVPGDDLVALVGLLREQNAALLAQNEALADYNARLAERVQQQDGEIVRLRARVAELERRLGRNSGNSNLPPSTDVFGRPGKDEQDEAKRKPTRPRGKQKGAPGSALRQVEAPDRIVEHRPAACTECGQDLAGIGPEQVTRRQVFDIPLVTVAVTEHRLCTLRCDCGRLTAAAAPDQVPASAVAYGPHLRALAVYLVVRQHVPVERTAELIREVTGAQVSAGWVASLLPRTAELVAPSLELIRALLVLSHVLHADETTTRIGAERHWLHVACTARLTLLGLAARSQAGADSLGVLPRFRGTLVHDSLGFYHRYTACTHQLCGAHLIRELTAAEEDHPKEQWHQQIRWALAGLNRQARRVASGEIEELPPDSLLFYLTAYHRG